MKPVLRILFAIALLAYLAMPFTGMGGMAMAPDSAAMDHAAMATAAQPDCPHAGVQSAKADRDNHSGTDQSLRAHCSACLMLPATVQFIDVGRSPRGPEIATAMPVLISTAVLPLDPPPRA